ncbi:MAG: hypothetical protein JST69_04435 [Bacteroidetes bacterium]|nr:hypothetical protein [Bacteroidota bacterium]
MAKSEVKIRKQLLDEAILHRHRNYASLLKQYERDKKRKWTKRFIIYSFIVAMMVTLLLLILSYWMVKLEHDREKKQPKASFAKITNAACRPITFAASASSAARCSYW